MNIITITRPAPRTPFSLLYNASLISSYRREGHEDLRTSFERFNVTHGGMQDACIRIENAAYELRVWSVDPKGNVPAPASVQPYRAARRNLNDATREFLELIASDLTSFLANFATFATRSDYVAAGTLVPAKWQKDDLLLTLVYHFLYVPDFAVTAVQDATLKATVLATEGLAVWTALECIADAMVTPRDPAVLHRQMLVLCDAVAKEYQLTGWAACW